MRRVYADTGYLMDPHTAVGYRALEILYPADQTAAVVRVNLSTASPVKFAEVISRIIPSYAPPPAPAVKLYKARIGNDPAAWSRILRPHRFVLIGMPGSGKSTLATLLEQRGWQIVDTDALLPPGYEGAGADFLEMEGRVLLEWATTSFVSFSVFFALCNASDLSLSPPQRAAICR